MGDIPSRSADANAGGPGSSRSAGTGVSPIPSAGPPLGGGGALPRKKSFGMEAGFRGLSIGAGAMVLVIIVAIGFFLVSKAVPALRANTENFLTYTSWFPNDADPNFGI